MFSKEVNPNANIIDEFFRFYNHFAEKHGKERTVLFMQVGSFHEAYQTNEDGFPLHKLSDVLNVIVSKRNKSIPEVSRKNPYMLGFPTASLQKNLKALMTAGYTVVIVDQVTPPPNPKRRLTGVYSPGTNVEDIGTMDSNYILIVYLEDLNQQQIAMGAVLMDVSTGVVTCKESVSDKVDPRKALDDACMLAGGRTPREVVVIHDMQNVQDALQYMELTVRQVYHINDAPGGKNAKKPSYQEQVFEKAYETSYLGNTISYLDLENHNYIRLAFCLAISYIHEFNNNLVHKLDIPSIIEDGNVLHLGNDATSQLNILPNGLFDTLNFTCTPMGRRLLKDRLAQPFCHQHDIEKRYEAVEVLMKEQVTDDLRGIMDIERLLRKMRLLSLHPQELATLLSGFDRCMLVMSKVIQLDFPLISMDFYKTLGEFFCRCTEMFNLTELGKYNLLDMTGSVFIPGKYKHIDEIQNEINMYEHLLDAAADVLDKKLREGTNTITPMIKVESNERDGHYFMITKARCVVLKQIMAKSSLKVGSIEIKLSDFEFNELPRASAVKIRWKEADVASLKLGRLMDRMRTMCKDAYIEVLKNLGSEFGEKLRKIVQGIAELDFCNSAARCALDRHYCRPSIEDKYNTKSYLDAVDLRHPIIEAILTNGVYVPTSISLGTPDQTGILLFGLNSAGKSSLQKAIGIAVICAQIGYYVPAKQFTYYPYKYLFTRIGGNDNLYRGLSSFALEMTELRAILKRSTSQTLVLADEVCRGTEHVSSLIIVMCMIEMLANNNTSFLTATHLHELVNMNRLKKLKNVQLYHLHIGYNEVTNELIYDRTLRRGSGKDFYGLQVAKYVMDDPKFLELARQVKDDIRPEPLVGSKKSNYNSNVFMTACEVCGYRPEKNGIPLESHHIEFQNGFVNGLHKEKFHLQKNHASNIIVLCASCHDKIDTKEIVITSVVETNKGRKVLIAHNE